jgi:hypothetical protein
MTDLFDRLNREAKVPSWRSKCRLDFAPVYGAYQRRLADPKPASRLTGRKRRLQSISPSASNASSEASLRVWLFVSRVHEEQAVRPPAAEAPRDARRG